MSTIAKRPHRSWWKLLAASTPLILIGIIAGNVWQNTSKGGEAYRQKTDLEMQQRIDAIEPRLPMFFADRQRLMDEPLFAPSPAGLEKDAGAMLHPRVRWRPAEPPETKEFDEAIDAYLAKSGRLMGELSFPEWDHAQLKRAGDRFALSSREVDAKLAVTSLFLDELLRFDHWDIDRESPRSYFPVDDLSHVDLSAPEPAFEDLEAWAQVRLMAGIRDNRTSEAIHVVRHLARLLVTTQNRSAMSHVIMLLADVALAEQAIAPQPSSRPTAASAEAVGRVRRHVLSAEGLIVPQIPSDVVSRVLDDRAPGVCGAVDAAAPMFQAMRLDLEKRHPAFYRRLDEFVTTSTNCRLTMARRFWRPRGDRRDQRRWLGAISPKEGLGAEIRQALAMEVPVILGVTTDRLVFAHVLWFEKPYVVNNAASDE